MFFDKVSGWKLFLAGFTVAENPFLVLMFEVFTKVSRLMLTTES